MTTRVAFACTAVVLAMLGCATVTPGTVSPPPPASPSSPSTAAVLPTVTVVPAPSGECYYVWATYDLPDVSSRFDAALKALTPGSSGDAYAYGEDCVAADGTKTFSAMETDFQVHVSVPDLSDKESLGNLIAKIMAIVLAVPSSQIQGPRSGRVEFDFSAPNAESHRLDVDIDTYKTQATGLQGARLFELLDRSP